MADRDPLSYFAAYGSSGSDSEPEPDVGVPEPGGGGDQARAQVPGSQAALPRPDELFSSVSRPSFLGRPGSGLINWEKRVVRAPEEPPREFKVWKTNAVPPPDTYAAEEKKPPSGVDMAVKWSCMYQDNGEDAPQRTLLPEEPEISDSDEEDGNDLSAKKRKIETFQQKEKRKRNQGQANREKSFVEEEKRILRQEFSLKD
ncbi:UPF0690 protein C1orf52 homolog [Stegostoma tigrinum]|uniref:UPF0690 protein C1orf52 homolog n=1 Tax=Stegostoma tigrinum TaxID=3053191 RepID=UPI00202B1928|nr:UPF0690 protein C1orf52 homolog [Stegostoma tigrinum]